MRDASHEACLIVYAGMASSCCARSVFSRWRIGQSAFRSAVDLRSPEQATVKKKLESGAVLPWGSSMSACPWTASVATARTDWPAIASGHCT